MGNDDEPSMFTSPVNRIFRATMYNVDLADEYG